ncbi:hypothetical protein Vasula_00009 [Pseudomonas phage vB_PpuP-Vasula]
MKNVDFITPIAVAAGHPNDQIVVEWVFHRATYETTLYVRHKPSRTELVIEHYADVPYECDGMALGDLFKYVTTPGQSITLTFDIAQKTIQFLKETA